MLQGVMFGSGAASDDPEPAAASRARWSLLAHQAEYLINAGALAAGTLAAACLGLIYWWVAARIVPPQVVGYAAAAISALNLLALAAECGVGAVLMAELQRDRAAGPSLVVTAMLAVLGSATALAALFLLVAGGFGVDLGAILKTPAGRALFMGTAALSGVAVVLDQAIAGLLRPGLQLTRNLLFGMLRLAALALLAFGFQEGIGEAHLLGTWLFGQSAAILWVLYRLSASRQATIRLARFGSLSPFIGRAGAHHLLNIAVQGPALALPFIVTAVLSPEANAPFFVGLMLLNAVLVVPGALVTLIQVVGTREPARLASRIRLSLGVSVGIGIGVAAIFFLFSRTLLDVINPAYADLGREDIRLLGCAALGYACKFHYLAVARLRQRLLPAVRLMGVGAIAEAGAALLGGHQGGLSGLVEGWVVATLAESMLMLPTVLRAAKSGVAASIRHRPDYPAAVLGAKA